MGISPGNNPGTPAKGMRSVYFVLHARAPASEAAITPTFLFAGANEARKRAQAENQLHSRLCAIRDDHRNDKFAAF
jgi:hypothetical protein